MAGKVNYIEVENFLSLSSVKLGLGALNVLVGPNGSGKSNILKVFQFLGDVARLDLAPAIQRFGGIENILFRGEKRASRKVTLKFKGEISKHSSAKALDEYKLEFREVMKTKFLSSVIERSEEITIKRTPGRGRRITLHGGSLNVVSFEKEKQTERSRLKFQPTSTGLATLQKLGEEYEASGVDAIARTFEQLRLFEIDVDRVRRAARWQEDAFLRADAGNLAFYLQRVANERPDIFEEICDDVRFVLPGFRAFEFVRVGGADDAVRIDIKEDKLSGTTPLANVSFGTIRSIALFAMLKDPNPPALTCLEEIDHGLHPHALDRLVDRIRDASSRTQIILATHSPALVNRFDESELIIVERDSETGGSRAFRPDMELVRELKAETGYELGELWFSGSLGGGL